MKHKMIIEISEKFSSLFITNVETYWTWQQTITLTIATFSLMQRHLRFLDSSFNWINFFSAVTALQKLVAGLMFTLPSSRSRPPWKFPKLESFYGYNWGFTLITTGSVYTIITEFSLQPSSTVLIDNSPVGENKTSQAVGFFTLINNYL